MAPRIVVTGATGFIGRILCQRLTGEGYEVVALSRNPDREGKQSGSGVRVVRWDAQSAEGWGHEADGAHAIINLAGENIGAGRWTEEKKRRILQSRLNAGKAIVGAVDRAEDKPKVVVQASGIGVYGDCGNHVCDESTPLGTGFLPDVGEQWEESTLHVTSHGVRHVVVRSGVVFGKSGGFLPRVVLPFRLFVGGHFGSGRQWFSWIHIDDEVRALRFLLEKEDAHGVFNLTSPNPLTSRDLSKTLGRVVKRPSLIPVPGIMLRILFGEMATELILSGQRAVPKRLLDAGYTFLYPEAEAALRHILNGNERSSNGE